jgi:hypothetical protein
MISVFWVTKNIVVSFLVIPSIMIQFFGYGLGFVKSYFKLAISNKNEEQLFPNLFFRSE